MRTPAGVEMSPRCARIYGWLNRRGIALTTFSTDECVLSLMPQLQRAMDDLRNMAGGDEQEPGGYSFTDDQLDQMEADLGAIMRRVPENRSTP